MEEFSVRRASTETITNEREENKMELKPKVMTQYCLDTQYFMETLGAIPSSIGIENLRFRTGQYYSQRRKLKVTNKFARMGVTNISQASPSIEYSGNFKGMRKKEMIRTMKEFCKETGISIDKVRVDYISLSFNGASGYFSRTTKEIRPDANDQRRKLIVLGMSSSDGNVKSLLAELSAKKYSCTFERVFTNHIICSQVK